MKTIIVPVDFSEYSEYALHAAAILAKKHKADILVVHMLELSTVHAYGEVTEADKLQKAIYYIRMAERKFDEFLQKDYLEGIGVTPIIRHFKVFSELDVVAKEKNADLIVMGSSGSSGISGFFVGSNTEKVVRHSEIPVLVIKKSPDNWDVNRIVFATDFSEDATPAFKKAIRLLDSMGAEVHLLYVNVPGDGFRSTDEMEYAVENFLQKSEGNLNRLPQVYYVADKTPERGILKYAQRINADIIAITTHGRTGLSRLFEGSISEDLANTADFPIMTFRKE